jgi:hypothetical protein
MHLSFTKRDNLNSALEYTKAKTIRMIYIIIKEEKPLIPPPPPPKEKEKKKRERK